MIYFLLELTYNSKLSRHVLLASNLAHVNAGIIKTGIFDVKIIVPSYFILVEVQICDMMSLALWVGDVQTSVMSPRCHMPPREGVLVAEALNCTVKERPLATRSHNVPWHVQYSNLAHLVICKTKNWNI